MDNAKKNNAENAANSLGTLAQCAVGVLSLMGTVIVALIGIAIEANTNTALFLFLASIMGMIAIFFHYLFRRWCFPYLIELLLFTSNDEYYGLKILSCHLFNIESWDVLRGTVVSYMYTVDCGYTKDTVKQLLQNQDVSALVDISLFPRHIGILLALWISEACLIIGFLLSVFVPGKS